MVFHKLIWKRVNVVITASNTPEEIAETKRDPWSQSAKYGHAFVYFSLVLLAFTSLVRFYHIWGDKIRIAKYKERQPVFFDSSDLCVSSDADHVTTSASTEASTAHLFPKTRLVSHTKREASWFSGFMPLQEVIALMRWIFYRPVPVLKIGTFCIVFPSLAVTAIVLAALVFVTCFSFLPQPLYYSSIALGSPPLAIRAGMLAIAIVPWTVALGIKANLISLLTGVSPERLNGLHRWSAYICLFLCLVHTIPFYITPIWENGAFINYRKFITIPIYVYGTGLAALVPLLVLCIHSLPILRRHAYELFLIVHIPLSWIFVAMLFWHSKNFLFSWGYLWATVAIWIATYVLRTFHSNWLNPIRFESFMVGEECTVTLLPQGAVKVTVPTRMRWRPGQYVYLSVPSVALFQSHPFTIASLCSDDFPSEYGEEYRDCTLVFRPMGGFTRRLAHQALINGPLHTYSAFLEGPYGGMQREMAAFDSVVFIAGGSGITAIISQLLNLIKKIRDGKAITRSVRVIWALKGPETMEWFQRELRICRDHAPAGILQCHLFLTGVRDVHGDRNAAQTRTRDMLQAIGNSSSKNVTEKTEDPVQSECPTSHDARQGGLTALPRAHTRPCVADDSQHQPDKNAVLVTPGLQRENWRADYYRPDIAKMLMEASGTFGRRACVFVCGPPSMRTEVASTVAGLQLQVMKGSSQDEIFLHAENYNV
ncbi:Uncharacterized protein PECH_002671 [Penicillium ucsense]|uniref:ferric-chelate reductase (NADPH) n=1 Tax=Penicillium ucsense TaxID=2839758 RepID=A0A8J8W6P2_9EURO|nr:Uncharacterized protein PECM_003612 [Penicillium ucsense]KAF7737842.1 Uncharacterized protein PECH_002671 [Penicillium ucsense]